MQQIPLTADPKQRFVTNLDGVPYDCRVKFNDLAEVWTLDLLDAETGDQIAMGMPIVLGADLLAPHNLSIGQIRAFPISSTGAEAGAEDLDTAIMLVFLDRKSDG